MLLDERSTYRFGDHFRMKKYRATSVVFQRRYKKIKGEHIAANANNMKGTYRDWTTRKRKWPFQVSAVSTR